MSADYVYEVIPAGEWKREAWQERAIDEDTVKERVRFAPTDTARPHIIPVSEDAKKVAAMDGYIGSFGAPLGFVLKAGEWILAYRFITLPPEHAHKAIIPDMTDQLRKVMRAARA